MDIPAETWFKVLLLVAKHSSEDLYSMAGTCKLFQQMLNEPKVWRTVSIEKYQWHEGWYRFHKAKIVEFLQKCKEHNNPEITYRAAFHDFFILKDDEAVNNLQVAAMVGHKESCYIVGLLGLLNPTLGKEDAMEFLCHLSKMKKIDMVACKESIIYRLQRYTIGVPTPPTLAKFTANDRYLREDCVHCEGNEEWLNTFDRKDNYSLDTWNCCEACIWKRELHWFHRNLSLQTAWI